MLLRHLLLFISPAEPLTEFAPVCIPTEEVKVTRGYMYPHRIKPEQVDRLLCHYASDGPCQGSAA